MLLSTALVPMLKYNLYLVFTLQKNNNKPHERLEAACRAQIHGSGGHVFPWSLISALATPGRAGSVILANRKWLHTAILGEKIASFFPATPEVSFGKTVSEKLVIKWS